MINKVILVGKIGIEPEIKYFNENTICILKLITTESYINKNKEKIINKEWHRVILYKNLTKYIKNNLIKGDIIYIEGKIKTRKWINKENNYNYITEIIAHNIKLISKYNKNYYENNYNNKNNNYNIENEIDLVSSEKINSYKKDLKKEIKNSITDNSNYETENEIDNEIFNEIYNDEIINKENEVNKKFNYKSSDNEDYDEINNEVNY